MASNIAVNSRGFSKTPQVIVTTIRSSNNLYRDEQALQCCVSFIFTWHVFCVSFHAQLELWTYESVPMVIPCQFVKTRWQSKYKMLRSVMANKVKIRAMCLQMKNAKPSKAVILLIMSGSGLRSASSQFFSFSVNSQLYFVSFDHRKLYLSMRSYLLGLELWKANIMSCRLRYGPL